MSSGTTGNAAGAAGNGGTGSTNNNNTRRRWGPARSNSTTPLITSPQGLEKAIFDYGSHVKPDQYQKSRVMVETYIQSTFKDPRDIVETIRTLTKPTALSPPPVPAAKDPAHPEIYECAFVEYKCKYEDYHKRSAQFAADEARAWAIIYGQCTASLRTQLEGASNFQACRDSWDVITLLTLIERLSSRLGDKQHSYYAVATTFRTLCMYYQPDGMSNDDYYHHFKSMVRVITQFAGDGAIGHLPTLRQSELEAICKDNGTSVSSATSSEKKQADSRARDKFCAALMLSGANVKKFKALKHDLSNSFALGNNNYPATMEGVLDLLNNYTTQSSTTRSPAASSSNASRNDAIEEQAMFAQGDAPLICNDCNQPGHIQRNCPRRRSNRRQPADTPTNTATPATADEQVHAMVSATDVANDDDSYEDETIFAQNITVIEPTTILLDNQSTVNQFASKELLTDIGPADRPIRVHSNAGSTVTTQQGNFGDIKVYYDEDGIANVLSLKSIAARHLVTYNSRDRGGVFIVHTPDGVLEFAPTPAGLHVLDLTKVPHTDVAAMLVNTVADNYEGYTKREVVKAHEARRFQRMVGCPSDRDFQGMVREKLIANCPVTVNDVHNANQIFGPDLANLRGKTVRRKPEHVGTDYVDIPRDFMDRHRNVTLTADVVFVNGLPFLITFSRGINLVTIEFATTRTAANLCKLLNRVIIVYAAAGLKIQTVMMDMEFQPLQELMPNIVVNTTAANEHVAEIERRIRVVKERARAIINTLPYPKLPKRMIVELMYFVTMWLNSFPVKGGISQKWSPRELLRRHKLDARLHCKAEFGAYCEVHDEPTPTNTMQRRTHATICLGPTGNLQGSYKFFCLTTGKKLTRRNFTVIPGVPQTIIDAVTRFATKENRATGLTFRNRANESFAFSNDDLDEVLVERPIAPFPDIPNELPGVTAAVTVLAPPPPLDDDELANIAAHAAGIDFNNPPLPLDDDGYVPPPLQPALVQANDDEIQLVPPVHHVPPNNNINEPHVIDFDHDTINDASSTSSSESSTDTDTSSDDDNDDNDDLDGHNDNTAPPAPTGRPQRNNAGKNKRYDDYHLFATAAETEFPMDESTLATVCHYLMVHYSQPSPPTHKSKRSTAAKKKSNVFSLSAGLKKFGDKGEAAVSKELNQFNMLNTFTPLDAKSLTYDQRRTALASLIFLTEKRNGDIKARACANGKPQREHIAKEETASPTVATEANFALAAIAAHERRFVATMDLPGAFLHADNDSFVVMKLTGKLAELMVKTAPNIYRKYVIEDSSGKPILYVQLQKALYGMLKSALLFYRKLVSDLTSLGFTLNPYDPCVANKIVNGNQLTVSWHVDDLTMSCVDEEPLHDVIKQLKNIYGQNLKESVGLVHDYLGMKFDYSTPGQVEISMDKYIANVIDSFPEKITGVSATPATDKLFLVRDDDRPLPEEQAIMFHHVTAQLLFASTRVRRDIQTTVAFLTTRVKQPGEDDWGKLKRVLKYLNGTRHLHLTLTVDSLSSIKWYVDGSHQIHDDCKGHTGALMTLGRGAIASSSRKQKINTKSSTETELIAVDDKLGDILWMRYFLESQGYTIEENIIFQDNMSTLSLEKNGRISGSSRTKHIRAKYYLIKDKYDTNEVDLKYCPTDLMWADVLTKPLQGQKFREMRSFLMNCPLDYSEI